MLKNFAVLLAVLWLLTLVLHVESRAVHLLLGAAILLLVYDYHIVNRHSHIEQR